MSGLKELMLRSPRLTLAAAESITCGRLQARIGAISGASQFFLGGITAYTIEQKVRHLGVDRAAADNDKAVSERIAGQMARGVCALFGADLGVATTGYAEPLPAPPYSWWAVAWRGSDGNFELRTGRVESPGRPRTQVQEQVAEAALAALTGWLETRRK